MRFAADGANEWFRRAAREMYAAGEPEQGARSPEWGAYVEIDDEGDFDEDGDAEGLLGLDDDLVTSMGRFAWAYVRGLGGLVVGVVDGWARGEPVGLVVGGRGGYERGRWG